MGGNLAHRTRLVELHADAVGAGAVLHVGHVGAIVVIRVWTVAFAVDFISAVVVFHVRPAGISLVVDLVAVQIVAAGHRPVFRIALGIARGTDGDGCQTSGGTGRTGFVVVAHHVYFATTRTSVTSVSAVVDDAVAEIDILGLHGILPFILAVELVAGIARPVVAGAIEAGRTVVDVADEVVVERGQLAAPDAAVAVSPLIVASVVEAFADGTPLHGEVVVVVERCHLVDAPRERAVVDHYAGKVAGCRSIGTIVDVLLLTSADAYETHDDIITVWIDGIIAQRNTRSRSRLSENGGVGTNADIAFQGDDSTHVEYHRLLVGTADGSTERASA